MENKKHVLVISQYFYPEQFRINDICTDLVNRGYKVTVVTGIPNYPQGKFYKGYGWFKNRKETWNGIDIIRLPIISRGKSSIRLIFNYLSFVFSGWWWKMFTKLKADKVFIYEVSPINQAKVGVWYAKKRKIPCSVYLMDLWPESFEAVTGIHNKVIINPIKKMVKKIYRGCDKIYISSRGYEQSVINGGGDSEKIEYWPQYAEEFYTAKALSEIDENSLKLPSDNKIKIVFAGNIGEAQGLDVLVGTAKILSEKGIFGVNFCLIGDGRYKEKLVKKVEESGVSDYFSFHKRVPATTIPDIMAQADASFICLAKSDLFALTLPAKTQSSLAVGKPILVCADGEVQRVINEAKCGFVANSGDAEVLAENIEKFCSLSPSDREKLGKNAVDYFNLHFRKDKLMDQLECYLLKD